MHMSIVVLRPEVPRTVTDFMAAVRLISETKKLGAPQGGLI